MAADRVAEGGGGANQILALHVAKEHRVRPPRRYHHDALAHRARLPGSKAGGGARPFRRARLARFPPPRHDVHRTRLATMSLLCDPNSRPKKNDRICDAVRLTQPTSMPRNCSWD